MPGHARPLQDAISTAKARRPPLQWLYGETLARSKGLEPLTL